MLSDFAQKRAKKSKNTEGPMFLGESGLVNAILELIDFFPKKIY
jgi:hypothetical protein